MAGWGSTEQTTSIPKPSEQEQALIDLVTQTMMPAYLEEAGYDVQTSTTAFEDTDAYKGLAAKRDELSKNREAAIAKANEFPQNSPQYNQQMAYASQFQQQLDETNTQINQGRDAYEPSTAYDVKKKENADLEYLKSKYGEGSTQYTQAKEKYASLEADKFKQQEQIYQTYMEKTLKFLNGDFSITSEQEALIQKNNAPIKAAIETMFKDTMEATDKAFGEFNDKITDGKMTVYAALNAVGDRIIQTGAEMEKALSDTITTHTALLKQGIDDYTGEITKRVASNAAAMGRDPSDPEYTADIANIVAKQVRSGELELADMESRGMLSIKERTGAGLENVESNKANVAMGVAQQKVGLTQQRGEAILNNENNISNMRYQVGAGMVPQQLQAGQGANAYSEAVALQRLQTAQGNIGVPMNFANYYTQQRMAQPTTTSYGDPMQAILGIGTGIAGGAAGIYGAYNTAQFLKGYKG